MINLSNGAPQDADMTRSPNRSSLFNDSETSRISLGFEAVDGSVPSTAPSKEVAAESLTTIRFQHYGISASSRPSPGHLDAENSLPESSEKASVDGDVITVASPYQLPIDPKEKLINAKLKNKYVMVDGTVVNGKGLGRGRPGIKRGPRKSALSVELLADGSESIELSTPSPASHSRSVSGKRKRTDSYLEDSPELDNDEDDVEDEDDYEHDSRDSTPEYIPSASTLTRSGRQSQKSIKPALTPTTLASPVTKRPNLTHSVPSPSIKKHPKIKAKIYRGREQFALCEHCLRGNGPPGNVIVFCDACNKCWHQRCHEPSITKEVVADTKAEWFCAECDKILHGKKKNKPGPKPALKAPQVPGQVLPPPPQLPMTVPMHLPPGVPKIKYGYPYIPGMSLSPSQKKEYLHSLSKERLIDIVIRAADLAPNMPIFETPYHLMAYPPNLPDQHSLSRSHTPTQSLPAPSPGPISQTPVPIPPRQAVSLKPIAPLRGNGPIYNHPTAGTTSKPNTLNEEDEGYYDDYDELALLYPKAGEGVYDLALAAEDTDLEIMMEGSDCKTFSHWVKGQGEMKRAIEPTKW